MQNTHVGKVGGKRPESMFYLISGGVQYSRQVFRLFCCSGNFTHFSRDCLLILSGKALTDYITRFRRGAEKLKSHLQSHHMIDFSGLLWGVRLPAESAVFYQGNYHYEKSGAIRMPPAERMEENFCFSYREWKIVLQVISKIISYFHSRLFSSE